MLEVEPTGQRGSAEVASAVTIIFGPPGKHWLRALVHL